MDKVEPQSKNTSLYILIPTLILVMAGSLYYYLRVTSPALFTDYSKKIDALQTKVDDQNTSTSLPESSPSPTPINPYVLPAGPQTYEFTYGDHVQGPKPKSLTLSPLSPSFGETQSAKLIIADPLPISKVTLTIVSDTLVTTHDLTLESGSNTDGVWTGSWTLNDTINSRYAARPTIIGGSGKYDTAMWIVSKQL